MTKKATFKKLVRARMAKTGERYSTARAHLLGRREPSQPEGVFAGYDHFGGQQSESGVLSNALRFAGRDVSEAMVHGLCGGVGFLYAVFEYAGHPPMLTIVGRCRSMPDVWIAEGIARAGVEFTKHETSGAKTARRHLDAALDEGKVALCVVDEAALRHRGLPTELAGMGPKLVAVVGRAASDAVWVDDMSTSPVRVSNDDLVAARTGYRKAKNRLYTIDGLSSGYDHKRAVKDAISFAKSAYEEPPVAQFASNIGSAGLAKWHRLLVDDKDKKGWKRVFDSGAKAYVGLRRVYDCINHDYSAPGAGRPLYGDFLDEATGVVDMPELENAAACFREAGRAWQALSDTIIDCDDVVARGCKLSDERAEAIDDAASPESVAALWRERASLAEQCTLDESARASIFAALADQVAAIIDAEKAAQASLP